MNVVAKSRLVRFWEKNPKAEPGLLTFYKIAKKATWKDFSGVRQTFPSADIYRDCVIFDIGGNKFCLVVKIRYRIGRIYVRHIMTHVEYDRGKWKDDCEC